MVSYFIFSSFDYGVVLLLAESFAIIHGVTIQLARLFYCCSSFCLNFLFLLLFSVFKFYFKNLLSFYHINTNDEPDFLFKIIFF